MQAQQKLAQAIELHKAGKIEEAEKLYNKIFYEYGKNLGIASILSVAYSSLADAYWDRNNIKIALEYYQRAVKLNPMNFEAQNNLGMLYSEQKMYQEAIKCYENAIAVDPQVPEIHNNIGTVYFEMGETEKAIKCHEQAIMLKPDYAEAYYNLGNAYKGNEKTKLGVKNPENLSMAHACYSKAIELEPDFVNAYVNLGLIYHYKNEPDNELACYAKAEQLSPDSAEIINNIGNMHRDAGRMDRALDYFEKAIKLDPQKDDAYINASITYLATKNFDKGWKYYELRLNDNHIYQKKLSEYKQPVWKGESLEGKRIYVYWEQGFGDTINFCRFLTKLREMGANVYFEPQKELAGLFISSNLGVDIVKDAPVEFDYHVPLLALPGLLGINDSNIPYNGKYLNADPEKVNYYKEKYFSNDCFKLGINWQCKNRLHVDQYRSVPHISYFYPLMGFANMKIYSFQKGCATEQLENLPEGLQVVNLGDGFNDFTDTAAALENLDLLISVDTSVPHLAAALGKPAWVLLQTVPDFRWGLEGENTPWYSTMQLFRQSSRNNWEEVITRVEEKLQKVISSKCTI